MALGQRRSDAVMKYLTDYGVASSRITTISYGEMRPAVQGHDEAAWSKNRRTDIIITDK
jgi:peptidoglycan-associated lipoprotein